MRTVLALFDAPASAASAVGALRGAAVPWCDIDVAPPWSRKPAMWTPVLEAAGVASAGAARSQHGGLGFLSASGPAELARGLRDLGVPSRDAAAYVEGVERGGCLVAARVPTAAAAEVSTTFDVLGALDLAAQSSRWAEDPNYRFGAAASLEG